MGTSNWGGVVVWTVVLVGVWLGQAVLTSEVAVRREHDRVLWFVLGIVFPGAALLALLLGYPRSHSRPGRLAPDLRDALERSRVARTLAEAGDLDEPALVAATGLPEDQVAGELRSLRFLGLARRGRDRSWGLTPRAAAALSEGGLD